MYDLSCTACCAQFEIARSNPGYRPDDALEAGSLDGWVYDLSCCAQSDMARSKPGYRPEAALEAGSLDGCACDLSC